MGWLKIRCQVNIVFSLSFHSVVWAAKGAILAMYYSLRQALSKALQVTVWVGIAYTSLMYVAMVLSTLLWCRPLSIMW